MGRYKMEELIINLCKDCKGFCICIGTRESLCLLKNPYSPAVTKLNELPTTLNEVLEVKHDLN